MCNCLQERSNLFGLIVGDDIFEQVIKKYEFKYCPYCGEKFQMYLLEKRQPRYVKIWEDLSYEIENYCDFYEYDGQFSFQFAGCWLNFRIATKTEKEAIDIGLDFAKKLKDAGKWGSTPLFLDIKPDLNRISK